MARGRDVLDAVLAGKRVRCRDLGWDDWLQLDRDTGLFVRDEGDPSSFIFSAFFHAGWEIESDPPMTFSEAVAAMDRGAVVQREHGDRWMWRKHPEDEFFECAAPEREIDWGGGSLDYDDVHATDWRIVPESSNGDEATRPTVAETEGFLYALYHDPVVRVSHLTPHELVQRLSVWRPAMFRKETADDAE